ncbi:MAG: SagB/ThcOx family dehydrogenase [Pseudomonadota bacterium]
MNNPVDDTVGLSQFFHLNSAPWVNENPVPNAPFVQKTLMYKDSPRVPLPKTTRGQVDQLAKDRRSCRNFSDTPMTLATCAGLLRSAYCVFDPGSGSSNTMLRRPVPSAGALYPLELYALVRSVEGLSPGIYHYDTIGDDLAALDGSNWPNSATNAFLSWDCVHDAPLILCLGAEFARTQAKYGPRGYRYVLFEAGHVAQNICLVAEEKGLSTLCMGGFYDDVLNRLIGFDGSQEAVLYAIAVGTAAAK